MFGVETCNSLGDKDLGQAQPPRRNPLPLLALLRVVTTKKP